MSRVTRFLIEHRPDILSHFERLEREGSAMLRYRPEPQWWILLAVVSDTSTQVNVVIPKLEGRNLTISNQSFEIEQLILNLKRSAFIEEPIVESDLESFNGVT